MVTILSCFKDTFYLENFKFHWTVNVYFNFWLYRVLLKISLIPYWIKIKSDKFIIAHYQINVNRYWTIDFFIISIIRPGVRGSRVQGPLAERSQGPGTITPGTRTITYILISTRDQNIKISHQDTGPPTETSMGAGTKPQKMARDNRFRVSMKKKA